MHQINCVSAHIHFKTFSGEHASRPPLEARGLISSDHSGILPQTINSRYNPARLGYISWTKELKSSHSKMRGEYNLL